MKKPVPAVGETETPSTIRGEIPREINEPELKDLSERIARKLAEPPTPPRPHGPISARELYELVFEQGRTGYCMSCGTFQGGITPDAQNVAHCVNCGLNAVVSTKRAVDSGVLVVV